MPAIYRGIITNLKKEDIVDTISNIVVRNETDIGTDYKHGNVFKGDFDSSHKKQYIEGKTSTSTVTTSRTTHTHMFTPLNLMVKEINLDIRLKMQILY